MPIFQETLPEPGNMPWPLRLYGSLFDQSIPMTGMAKFPSISSGAAAKQALQMLGHVSKDMNDPMGNILKNYPGARPPLEQLPLLSYGDIKRMIPGQVLNGYATQNINRGVLSGLFNPAREGTLNERLSLGATSGDMRKYAMMLLKLLSPTQQ